MQTMQPATSQPFEDSDSRHSRHSRQILRGGRDMTPEGRRRAVAEVLALGVRRHLEGSKVARPPSVANGEVRPTP
jgi:hypothetical protein